MLGKLAPGDVVTVTRIDRLARSTFDLFGIVKRIVDAKSQFRSLAEPWADTGTSTGRLMLAVLGGIADVERDLIRTRTAEGRSRAKAQGKPMGRPPSLHRPNRKRRPNGARGVLRCRNWRTATTAAFPLCAAQRTRDDSRQNDREMRILLAIISIILTLLTAGARTGPDRRNFQSIKVGDKVTSTPLDPKPYLHEDNCDRWPCFSYIMRCLYSIDRVLAVSTLNSCSAPRASCISQQLVRVVFFSTSSRYRNRHSIAIPES